MNGSRISGSCIAMAVAAFAVVACKTTIAQGYANNRAGRASHEEMCRSLRTFVRAQLDDEGLRRAWFLPFSSYEDGSFDFYAPMGAKPSDGASHAFYEHRVGQLTHYLLPPDFAAALMSCLTPAEGFKRIAWNQGENEASGEVGDVQSERQIIIRASYSTTFFFVADKNWRGDIDANLMWSCDDTKSVVSPNQSLEQTRER